MPSPAMLGQFLRFGVVGSFGFVIDTATVYGLRARLGLLAAGMVAWLVAASANWVANRLWTFRSHAAPDTAPGRARQWGRFLLANLAGLALNRGSFALLVVTSGFCAANPVVALAAGAIAGMFVNFALSRRYVFV